MKLFKHIRDKVFQSSVGILPVNAEPAELPAETKMDEELPKGSETILVAEDEETVREFITSILKTLGYQVAEASDGEEAFKLLGGKLAGKVDLVFTDIVMPKINGKELAYLVERNDPLTKILFCSGYPEKLAARNGMIDPKLPFLQKPFSPQVLAFKVREVLDSPYAPTPMFGRDDGPAAVQIDSIDIKGPLPDS